MQGSNNSQADGVKGLYKYKVIQWEWASLRNNGVIRKSFVPEERIGKKYVRDDLWG